MNIKQRVFLDLVVTPATILLTALGVTLLLWSWATGLGILWSFLGFTAILASGGIAATNFIFNLESATVKALKAQQQEQRVVKDKELDELYGMLQTQRLRTPAKATAASCLRTIRECYSDLEHDIEDGKVSKYITSETIEQVDLLFAAIVKSLRHACSLGELAKTTGKSRQERDSILDEVDKSVQQFSSTVAKIRSLGHKSQSCDLANLRNQLDISLEVAKRSEQRIEELDGIERFRDFLGPEQH